MTDVKLHGKQIGKKYLPIGFCSWCAG